MMNKNIQKIYISDNIEALDTLAITGIQDIKIKGDKMISSARKLYTEFNKLQNDQEMAYIVGKRYLMVLDSMFRTTNDKKYMEVRYATEYKKMRDAMEELKMVLKKRYMDLYNQKAVERVPVIIPVEEVKSETLFTVSGNFITCKNLYKALEQKELNMILIDIRSAEEFQTSKINYKNCINIPENIISAGLSANTLGEKLPPDVQKYWDKRDSYDLLVLVDWNSNSENICSSKLEMLRTFIVDWDFNRHYKHYPVFLSGGFKELLDTYPAMVTNAHTYLVHKNDELDELLEIDNVIYPTDAEGNFVNTSIESSNISADSNNLTDLINESVKDESNTPISDAVLLPDMLPLSQPGEMHVKIIESPESPETPITPPDDDADIKNAMEADRQKMLLEARAKKPTIPLEPSSISSKPTRPPTINRSIKPMGLNEKIVGRVGLRNIRNTCYMNAAIQCLRVLPVIKYMFQSGYYKKFITSRKPELINDLANLIIKLWTYNDTYIDPTDFYNKVCLIEKIYRRGNHEDSMEFFIFLFNKISEDCSFDMPRSDVLTPRLEAKICQLLGKTSIFVDIFFHEVRNQRHCTNCKTSSYSFELDNTLMLHLPNSNSHISNLVYDYFQEYSIPDYCCSKCKKPVRNKREVVGCPAVLVIVLKRYSQYFSEVGQDLCKNNSCVGFENNIKFGNYNYKLFSFAMHQGTLQSGHYTAGCLIENEWYEMNDEIVRPMNIDTDSVRSKVCSFFYLREGTYQI